MDLWCDLAELFLCLKASGHIVSISLSLWKQSLQMLKGVVLSLGSPDAPLDVRVENGPLAGILIISWLPVTIDSEGSSNGVRVTGYAIYADKQKVQSYPWTQTAPGDP